MKRLFVCLLLFIFPTFYTRWLLNILGCKIGKNVKVGFNFIYVDSLILDDNVKIKSFNFIKIKTLKMSDRSIAVDTKEDLKKVRKVLNYKK